MKKQLTGEYLELLAQSEFATTYHYKVVLLLLTGTYTQAQLAEMLNMKRQNVHRCTKDLLANGYISVERTEGKNKFLKANTSVSSIKKAALVSEVPDGQLSLTDVPNA